MAIILNNGVAGATSTTHAATGVTEVICAGNFGICTVAIEVRGDATTDWAPAHTFFAPGGVSLQVASGTSIRAKVAGQASPVAAIDVTCNP